MEEMWEVVSYDNLYYWTDGVIEDVLVTNIRSQKRAEEICARFRRQATPTPYTGFYVRKVQRDK